MWSVGVQIEKGTSKCQIIFLIFFAFPQFYAPGNTPAELTSLSSHLSCSLFTLSQQFQPIFQDPFFSNQKICVAFVLLHWQRLWGCWFLKCRWSLWVAPRFQAKKWGSTDTVDPSQTHIKGHLFHTCSHIHSNTHTHTNKQFKWGIPQLQFDSCMAKIYTCAADTDTAENQCMTLNREFALFYS